MVEPAPSQLFPIVVGVSGHIDIVPEAVDPIRAAVAAVLTELRETFGAALHVLTGLAEGADQLVAQEARKLGIRIIAALPMKMPRYAATLPSDAGREILADFWARADLQLQLPELCDPATPDYDELHYEQLGVLLARRSHLLLALWNGDAPAVPAKGGTADVITMRAGGTHDRAAARQSPWFCKSHTRLDLSRGGPVLQIVTPRVKNGRVVLVPGQDAPVAGGCFLLPPPSLPREVDRGGLLDKMAEDDALDFASLATLNAQIARFKALDGAIFHSQIADLNQKRVGDPRGISKKHLDQLRAWQAAPDVAAQRYQRRLLGQFAPAPHWSSLLVKGWNVVRMNWSQKRPPGMPWWTILLPRLGVIFTFTALVPLAVLLFEIHVADNFHPLWLLAYISLFLVVLGYYRYRVMPEQWQDRFQDYRALAEAMRVQLFWGLARLPDGVADYTLRQQRGELGWINFALRGPALWAAALAENLSVPERSLITTGWIEHQRDYFVGPTADAGASGRNATYAHSAENWSKWLLWFGIATAVLMLAIEAVRHYFVPHSTPHDASDRMKEVLEFLTVVAAAAPAVSAFFVLWAELRAYAAHSHSYGLMGRVFNHALSAKQTSDEDFQDLVHELGREALLENAEWLLDHRHRKIDPKAG